MPNHHFTRHLKLQKFELDASQQQNTQPNKKKAT